MKFVEDDVVETTNDESEEIKNDIKSVEDDAVKKINKSSSE